MRFDLYIFVERFEDLHCLNLNCQKEKQNKTKQKTERKRKKVTS